MIEEIPDRFIKDLHSHFGEHIADRVIGALVAPTSVSIRQNPNKPSRIPAQGIQVPWSKQGYLMRERPNFALDPLFHAGAFYVQDSSSMILEEVLRSIDAPRSGVYLDACASPGGKSTIVMDHIGDDGFLVANEIHPQRNAVLRENLLKWGNINHGVTALSTEAIQENGAQFDIVLIDAPCSGEGMFRKDAFARKQWSHELIDQCATTQSQILSDLKDSVAKGGYIIYSTCTTNPKENEDQISGFIQEEDFELAVPKLDKLDEWLVPAEVDGLLIGYYLLPGISTGEGLFFSVIRKTGTGEASLISSILERTQDVDPLFAEAFPNWPLKDVCAWEWKDVHHIVGNADIAPHLYYKRLGLPAYEMKGKNVIPQHGLAMWPTTVPSIPLDIETALQYLRKESISLPRETEKGWHLVAFEGVPLGWVKALGSRTNNYYPNGFRLRI